MNSDAELVLLKTGFSKFRSQDRYWKLNLGLSLEFANWIRKKFKKIKIIGIDSISISSWVHRDIGRKAHKKLLSNKKPVLLIEDMDLNKIGEKTIIKKIYIAPLRVSGASGCPCTIIAEIE